MGRVIAGRYAVQVSLGRGGMGEVFLAHDQLLQRRVAIKEIISGRESGLDSVAVERLIREARLAAGIQHPHVVAVHDLIVEDNQTFIVMEYLDARSLAEMIRAQTCLDPITVATVGSQVAGALESAHRAGIIHRDVKPSNILIDAEGNAKLADFGVARGSADTSLTGTGMLIGSLAFMAPEVAKGEPVGPAADIFSLGCTLFAATEGRAPFTDAADPTNSLRTLVRLVSETAPPATHAGPLRPLLARMLDPDPKGRPSAGEVQRQLATISISPTTEIATPNSITASPTDDATTPQPNSSDQVGTMVGATRLVTNRSTPDEYLEPDEPADPSSGDDPGDPHPVHVSDSTFTVQRMSSQNGIPLQEARFATVITPSPPASDSKESKPAPRAPHKDTVDGSSEVDPEQATLLRTPHREAAGPSISTLPATRPTQSRSSEDLASSAASPPAVDTVQRRLGRSRTRGLLFGAATVIVVAAIAGGAVMAQSGGGVPVAGPTLSPGPGTSAPITSGPTASISAVAAGSARATLSAGGEHFCAITSTGGVKCWGSNEYGQLGNGSKKSSSKPVGVVGLGSGVRALTSGTYHTCALTQAGGVKCWGTNIYGRLGNGSFAASSRPVDVVGLSSGVVQIASYAKFTCAVTSGGAVKCWGSNWSSSLGNRSSTDRSSKPVTVKGISGAKSVAVGYEHACAVIGGGEVKCWGSNSDGQLGDGSTDDSPAPVKVIGLVAPVVAVYSGGWNTCALTDSGSVQCWGGMDGSPDVVDVPDLPSDVATLAMADGMGCVVAVAGGLTCNSSETFTEPLKVVPGVSSGVVEVTIGLGRTCARTDSGTVECWGDSGKPSTVPGL